MPWGRSGQCQSTRRRFETSIDIPYKATSFKLCGCNVVCFKKRSGDDQLSFTTGSLNLKHIHCGIRLGWLGEEKVWLDEQKIKIKHKAKMSNSESKIKNHRNDPSQPFYPYNSHQQSPQSDLSASSILVLPHPKLTDHTSITSATSLGQCLSPYLWTHEGLREVCQTNWGSWRTVAGSKNKMLMKWTFISTELQTHITTENFLAIRCTQTWCKKA